MANPNQPIAALPSIEDSVRTAHLSAARAERVLGGLLARLDLYATEPQDPGENCSSGLNGDAHSLSCRVEALANLAERVANKVAPMPPEVTPGQASFKPYPGLL